MFEGNLFDVALRGDVPGVDDLMRQATPEERDALRAACRIIQNALEEAGPVGGTGGPISPQSMLAVEQIDAAHQLCSGPLHWVEYTPLPSAKRGDVTAVFECPTCKRRVYIETDKRSVTTQVVGEWVE